LAAEADVVFVVFVEERQETKASFSCLRGSLGFIGNIFAREHPKTVRAHASRC